MTFCRENTFPPTLLRVAHTTVSTQHFKNPGQYNKYLIGICCHFDNWLLQAILHMKPLMIQCSHYNLVFKQLCETWFPV